jgi:hypothetical protein
LSYLAPGVIVATGATFATNTILREHGRRFRHRTVSAQVTGKIDGYRQRAVVVSAQLCVELPAPRVRCHPARFAW